jgi:hypothetical protein
MFFLLCLCQLQLVCALHWSFMRNQFTFFKSSWRSIDEQGDCKFLKEPFWAKAPWQITCYLNWCFFFNLSLHATIPRPTITKFKKSYDRFWSILYWLVCNIEWIYLKQHECIILKFMHIIIYYWWINIRLIIPHVIIQAMMICWNENFFL